MIRLCELLSTNFNQLVHDQQSINQSATLNGKAGLSVRKLGAIDYKLMTQFNVFLIAQYDITIKCFSCHRVGKWFKKCVSCKRYPVQVSK